MDFVILAVTVLGFLGTAFVGLGAYGQLSGQLTQLLEQATNQRKIHSSYNVCGKCGRVVARYNEEGICANCVNE